MKNYKYISEETKRLLKILDDYEDKVKNMTLEESRQELINTGLYKENGELIDELKG